MQQPIPSLTTDANAHDAGPDKHQDHQPKALGTGLRRQESGAATDVDAGFSTPMIWQNLDVVLVLVALVPALAFGAPELGFILGAGGWILTRMVAVVDKRWIGKSSDPMKQLMFNLFEAFGRIWLLAGVIVIAAVAGDRRDGLTASLVIFGAYSVAFVIRLLSGASRSRAVK